MRVILFSASKFNEANSWILKHFSTFKMGPTAKWSQVLSWDNYLNFSPSLSANKLTVFLLWKFWKCFHKVVYIHNKWQTGRVLHKHYENLNISQPNKIFLFSFIFILSGPPSNSPVSSGSDILVGSPSLFKTLLCIPILCVSILSLRSMNILYLRIYQNIQTLHSPLYSKLHYLFNVKHWKKKAHYHDFILCRINL